MNVTAQHPVYSQLAGNTEAGYSLLQRKLMNACLLNFFLLSLVGLLLRAWPLFNIPYFLYKNVLHAHSHFAFGGWVMPALMLVLLKIFPEIGSRENFTHWRNCILIMLLSAYGMLLSFPFQGYGAVSIVFSTLSIISGYYAGFITWSVRRPAIFLTSRAFLGAAFFYFYLSSIGPFATAPLIAMGKVGTAIYFNAIYFYLHFQYNGFFTFLVLAVLYKMVERHNPLNNGKLVFKLFVVACIPAYFLSVLWTQPGILFYVLGGSAAAVQMIAVTFILKDIKRIGWKNDKAGWLFRMAISAFILKNVLQLLSAVPAIANLAYQTRNFIIAYLHLVLIGFISLFIFGVILRDAFRHRIRMAWNGLLFFLFGFAATELLLVLQASGWLSFLPSLFYCRLLFGLSIFFPGGLLMINFTVKNVGSLSAGRLSADRCGK